VRAWFKYYISLSRLLTSFSEPLDDAVEAETYVCVSVRSSTRHTHTEQIQQADAKKIAFIGFASHLFK
jgi:hypothetical protein